MIKVTMVLTSSWCCLALVFLVYEISMYCLLLINIIALVVASLVIASLVVNPLAVASLVVNPLAVAFVATSQVVDPLAVAFVATSQAVNPQDIASCLDLGNPQVVALAAVGTYLATAFRVVVVTENTYLVAVAASCQGPGSPLATACPFPCPYPSQYQQM